MNPQRQQQFRLLMVGLPATGKTSYLAALWHLVESDLPSKSWYQYRYGDETEYMNRIRQRWLECQQQVRTNQETQTNRHVELYLEQATTQHRLTLQVPDIEGEQFSNQWSNRTWSVAYDQLVHAANGLLLFLNPNQVKSPTLLTDVVPLREAFIEAGSVSSGGSEGWQPQLSPTQVVAVDLLQFHLPCLIDPKQASLAIIISAWDTVLAQDETLTPDAWIEMNMPLLHQFLTVNEESIKFSVFGVSAQGGDYASPTDRDRLAEQEEPAERIVVQQQAIRDHNLMAPIEWAMQAWT